MRKKYKKVFGTHLAIESQSLYELDLVQPTALVFGNEHAGITENTLSRLDGNFIIPQVGMVQSLNISVACAVTLYEAFRQRHRQGLYDGSSLEQSTFKRIRDNLIDRHESRYKGRSHDVKKDGD